jgi:cyanophycin synthetase
MILEVNAGPSLSMHIAPLHGQPQPVGEAIVDMLFEAGATGRVPMVAVTGMGDRAAIVAQVEQLWREAGMDCGAATREGVRIAGRSVPSDALTDCQRVRALLLHPRVEAAVFESQPQEAAERGMGCSRCDVVIVTAESNRSPAQAIDGIVAAVRAVPSSGVVLLEPASGLFDRLAAVCRGRVVELTSEALRDAVLPAGVTVGQLAGVL